ncbi:hypothetical protein MMPV_003701 [Pyropia vietnamensis]
MSSFADGGAPPRPSTAPPPPPVPEGSPPPMNMWLPPLTEFRFEVPPDGSASLTLTDGTAEVGGVELPRGVLTPFTGGPGGRNVAAFTWHGAWLSVAAPDPDELLAYTAEDTPMPVYLNLHSVLEHARSAAATTGGAGGIGNGGGGGEAGPIVAVVGGADVGKSTLAGLLTAWCVKSHGVAVAVEADPGEVAAPFAGMVGGVGISVVRHVDVAAGGVLHEKPLAWSYGSPGVGSSGGGGATAGGGGGGAGGGGATGDGLSGGGDGGGGGGGGSGAVGAASGGDRGHLVHLAGVMGNVLRQVLPSLGGVGAIVNTSSDVDGADAVASLAELCAALGVGVVVVVGGERLAAALRRALKASATTAAAPAGAAITPTGVAPSTTEVTVVAVPKSGGVVSRGAPARRKALAARVREYFYGTAGNLCPFTIVAEWADVTFVWVDGARRLPDSLLPAGEASTLERVGVREVDLALGGGGVVHAVCGVSQATALSDVLSSPVWGWAHVAKVDSEKRTVTLLAPSAGRLPGRYLLVGGIKWLE